MGSLCSGSRKKIVKLDGNCLFVRIIGIQKLQIPLEKAKNLFVRVSVSPHLSLDFCETEYISDTLNPFWEQNGSIKFERKPNKDEKYTILFELISNDDKNNLIAAGIADLNSLFIDENNWINENYPLVSIGGKLKVMGAIYIKASYFSQEISEENAEILQPEDIRNNFNIVFTNKLTKDNIPKKNGNINLVFKKISGLEDVQEIYFFEILLENQKFVIGDLKGKKEILIDKEKGNLNMRLSFDFEEKNIPVEIILYKKKIAEENKIESKKMMLKKFIKQHGNWHEDESLVFKDKKISIMFNCRFLLDNFNYKNVDFYQINGEMKNEMDNDGKEGILFVNVFRGENLFNTDADIGEYPDPYVEFSFNFSDQKHFTVVRNSKLNPVWNSKNQFNLKISENKLKNGTIDFKIWDLDHVGQDFMGGAILKLNKCVENNNFGKWQKEELELKAEELKWKELGKLIVFYAWKPKEIDMKNEFSLEENLIKDLNKIDLPFDSEDIEDELNKANHEFETNKEINVEKTIKTLMKTFEQIKNNLADNFEKIKNEVFENVKKNENFNKNDKELAIEILFEEISEILSKNVSEIMKGYNKKNYF